MRSRKWILGLALVAIGCGPSARTTVQAPEAPTEPLKIDIPDRAPATRIGLIRNGRAVQVGDTAETALSIFPKEDRSQPTELPDGWPKSFHAEGWETEKAGFGVILSGERVVAAVSSEQGVAQGRVDRIVADYTEFLGAPGETPASASTQYWIWEDSPYRCVICSTRNALGQMVVTVGMGFGSVMDALGMNATAADSDMRKAESLLAKPPPG